MNAATLVTLAVVLLIIAFAVYRVCRMVRGNDMCYACPEKGKCCGSNPINCTVRSEK